MISIDRYFAVVAAGRFLRHDEGNDCVPRRKKYNNAIVRSIYTDNYLDYEDAVTNSVPQWTVDAMNKREALPQWLIGRQKRKYEGLIFK